MSSRILTQGLRTPSHLLHESAMRRDQICPSSNKEGCLITHPLFAIYKPDPFDRTAQFSPPPSHRLFTSSFCPVVSEQRWNESNGAFYPSGDENLGAFSLNVVYVFESPNFLREWSTTASTRCLQPREGIGFVYRIKSMCD